MHWRSILCYTNLSFNISTSHKQCTFYVNVQIYKLKALELISLFNNIMYDLRIVLYLMKNKMLNLLAEHIACKLNWNVILEHSLCYSWQSMGLCWKSFTCYCLSLAMETNICKVFILIKSLFLKQCIDLRFIQIRELRHMRHTCKWMSSLVNFKIITWKLFNILNGKNWVYFIC